MFHEPRRGPLDAAGTGAAIFTEAGRELADPAGVAALAIRRM